ncbi:hypothetical protein [Pseudooctadecabacter jejudonensis]|uniref:Uncharacterized protein n=1 Tax=Pseudooctadecabacter jejudonensis TaxID=1391910 RepID=A0A1Y5T7S0_9RHOB|nr:hypothetical protein [Pseudooctadecabacter jejudonensis]SLN54395.1 hypothetical protein PSJ8397_02844 [Pseudooctadecabacter jejudonensis]
MLLTLYLLGAISFGPACLIAAALRHRPTVVWYWNGFLLQPVALAILLSLPPLDPPPRRATSPP